MDASEEKKKRIVSFKDLEVYRNTYEACLLLHREILPKLPKSEHFDLRDQLSRSSKGAPRLIAEGYAKRHQRLGFQRYLDDAMAECNETLVGIEQVRDLYNIDPEICNQLILIYDRSGRQLYRLAEAWNKFKTKDLSVG